MKRVPSTAPPRSEALLTAGSIAIAVSVVAAIAVRHLPPGVSYGDSGDLQLAAATLGVAHPPGYSGYLSALYLLTSATRADPAYVVSLACMTTGLVAIGLCIVTQVRLGVHAAIAAALALLMALHWQFRAGLVAAEVYLPTLMLEAAAVLFLLVLFERGRASWLYAAAFVFGVAVANRPPLALVAPFAAAAAWSAFRRHRGDGGPLMPTRKSVALAAALALLPQVYAFAYVWVRDRPETAYNYMEQYNRETGILPPATGGTAARWERAWWQLSGRQYAARVSTSWPAVRQRLAGLWHELPQGPAELVIGVLLAAAGLVLTWRRNRAAALALVGMAGGSVGYIAVYYVQGSAADLLPALYAATVLCGAGLSRLFPSHAPPHCRRCRRRADRDRGLDRDPAGDDAGGEQRCLDVSRPAGHGLAAGTNRDPDDLGARHAAVVREARSHGAAGRRRDQRRAGELGSPASGGHRSPRSRRGAQPLLGDFGVDALPQRLAPPGSRLESPMPIGLRQLGANG